MSLNQDAHSIIALCGHVTIAYVFPLSCNLNDSIHVALYEGPLR